MKRYKLNERGSTLLIVIMIMVVFSILFFSFISISMNTGKQNERIEESYQAMALAEMGVQYYQQGVSNIIENYKNNQVKTAVEEISAIQRDRTLSKEQANTAIASKIAALMKNIISDINLFLNNQNSMTLSDGHTFKLIAGDSIFPGLNETVPRWKITIEGNPHSSTSKKKIATNYILVETDLIKVSPTDDDDTEDSEDFPSTAHPPEKKEPQENKALNVSAGRFDANGNYSSTAVFERPNNVKIEALGNVTIGNIKNMQSMEIKANGKVTLQQAGDAKNFFLYANNGASLNNFNTLKDSEIHIYGQTTMQDVKNIENSTISIRGYTEMNSVNPLKNSSISIFDHAKIDSLENFTNSTMFVEKDLRVFNKILINDAASSVFVGGTLFVTQENAEVKKGTVIVKNINVAGTSRESFKVNGSGKLCIKDLNSLPQLNNQKIKATGGGKIIFLDTRLQDGYIQKLIDVKNSNPTYYTTVSTSDLADNYVQVAGIGAFNDACGLEQPIPLDMYEVNPAPLDMEYEIDYND